MDIAARFQEVAKQVPQKPFIIFKDQTITYQEAAKKINKLANALIKQGLIENDKVAVCLPNCPEYIFSYLAVFSLGAAIVPLDVRLTDEETAGILKHSEASVFINKSNIDQMMQEGSDKPTNIKANDEALAVLYYTSGTTGKPKAVMSNYKSLDNATETMRFAGLNEEKFGDVEICALPLSHIGGFIYIQLALEFVMSIVLMGRFVPVEFLKNVEKYKVSWFHLVPAMFGALLQLKEFEKYDLKSVLGVDIFGAPSHPSLIKRFGQYCPNAILWHGWGMTETAAPNTITDPEHIASVGKAPPWFKVKIVDNDDKELPLGEVGEIVCSGWPIMMGYYKEPELTAEILRNGWLHTGDLGMLDKEGYLYIRGRKKDMIIVGGLNVYSPEVEGVISLHPAVQEVAVVGVPDKVRGEAIKAAVVLKSEAQATDLDIKTFCREKLTHFKIPQIVEFRDSLPKTRTGKVQKEALKTTP